MNKEPFRSYTLDEERNGPKRDIFSVSLNPEERALLDQFKRNTHIPSDSKAIKLLAFTGANVINSVFGLKTLRYLASVDRTRELI